MKKVSIILLLFVVSLHQCQEPVVYPDVPQIDYETFYLYVNVNSLNQEVLTGNLNFSFTDGDGNIGFEPWPDTLAITLPDTQRYNLFLQLYDYKDNEYVQIPEEEGGYLKYIIPYLDKQPLTGTVSVTIEYPIITYDTIFYTFFLYDREYNKSNIDTTDVQILSGIELNN
jgi:hypothetical protein